MNFRIIIYAMIILLISVSVVSANEINETDTLEYNHNDVIQSIDSDNLNNSDNELLEVNDNEILTTSSSVSSYKDLEKAIKDNVDVINIQSNIDWGTFNIEFEHDVTIEGNGNTFFKAGSNSFFVSYDNSCRVILNNITFIDDSNNDGAGAFIGASYSDTKFIISNCNFINSKTKVNIINLGSGTSIISNCNFINNTALNMEDKFGIISSHGELNISYCNFINNVVSSGGVIYDDNNTRVNIAYCNFTDNTANSGYAISSKGFVNCTYSIFKKNTFSAPISCDNGEVQYNVFVNGNDVNLAIMKYNWFGKNDPSGDDYLNIKFDVETVTKFNDNNLVVFTVNFVKSGSGELCNLPFSYPVEYYPYSGRITGGKNIGDVSYWVGPQSDSNAKLVRATVDEADIYLNQPDIPVADFSFSALQTIVDYAIVNKMNISLNKDFVFNSSKDQSLVNGVVINDSVVIDANNHTIDAKNQARIFNITQGNVRLINLKLDNGNSNNGGAIYSDANSLDLIECSFNNNTASNGGAVYVTPNKTLNLNKVSANNNSYSDRKNKKYGTFYVVGVNFSYNDLVLGEKQDIWDGNYRLSVIYVSPRGNGWGATPEDPSSLDDALKHIMPNGKIILDDGEYNIAQVLNVNSSVSFINNGSSLKSSNGGYLFKISNNAVVALENFTINSGIMVESGKLSLNNVTFNNAKNGVGITYARGTEGIINNSVFTNNELNEDYIININGNVDIDHITVCDNKASGVLFDTNAKGSLINSEFRNNGGDIRNINRLSSDININNNTFYVNIKIDDSINSQFDTDFTVNGIFDAGINFPLNNIILTLNDTENSNKTVSVNDKGNFSFDVNAYDLNIGTYSIKNDVIVVGGNNFVVKSSDSFNVTKGIVSFSIEVDDIKIGSKPLINIKFSKPDIDGSVTINILGNDVTVSFNNSQLIYEWDSINVAGNHSVNVTFNGDEYFDVAYNFTSFVVNYYNADDLQKLIDDAIANNTKELTLPHDYVFGDDENIPVKIDKPIIINGDGHNIDARGKPGIFDIDSDDVAIKDLALENVKDGTVINGTGDNITVSDVNITNSTNKGISIVGNDANLDNLSFNDIKGTAIEIIGNNSDIQDSDINNIIGTGINVTGDNETIKGINIDGKEKLGIAGKGDNITVSDVNITNFKGTGIKIDGNNATVEDAGITNITGTGINVTGDDGTIKGIAIDGKEGLGIGGKGDNITVSDVNITNFKGTGIQIDGNNATVEDAGIANITGEGIKVNGNDDDIKNITIDGNDGVGIDGKGDNNTVSDINITDSKGTGIAIDGNNNTVGNVTGKDNDGTLVVVDGDNNNITNITADNGKGTIVDIIGGNNNTVDGINSTGNHTGDLINDNGANTTVHGLTLDENTTFDLSKANASPSIFIVNLPKDATGVFTVSFDDGKEYKESVSNGTASISVPGLPTFVDIPVVLSYSEDKIYNPLYKTATIKITGNITPDEGIFDLSKANATPSVFIINLNDTTATGLFTVTINKDKTYNANVTNGTASIRVPGLPRGEYISVVLSYSGDNLYNPLNKTATINIPKITPSVNIFDLSKANATPSVFIINLHNVTAGGFFNVTVNNKKYNAIVRNGTATITVYGLPTGVNIPVLLNYSGDNTFNQVNITKTIKIPDYSTKIVAKKKVTFKKNKRNKNKKFTVTLKTKAGKAVPSQKVFFKLDKKILKKIKAKNKKGKKLLKKLKKGKYSAKTKSSGKATLKLKKSMFKFKKGKGKLTASFKRVGIYKASSAKIKIVMK